MHQMFILAESVFLILHLWIQHEGKNRKKNGVEALMGNFVCRKKQVGWFYCDQSVT
jgi:hypothetical protein